MKYIFSIFLIFTIFGFSLTDKLRQKKVELLAKSLKNVLIQRELKKRMLQSEEQTNVPSNSTEPEEDTNADEDAKEVSPQSPVSTKGTNVGKPFSEVQIMKFYNFKAQNKNINFGVFFFFYKRKISFKVKFRLRVTVNQRQLRNMADEREAESVRTECSLKDPSLEGNPTDGGEKVDYNCNAETDKITDVSKANISLNTDVDMLLEDRDGKQEPVDFINVNFKGNSSVEASNLQEVKDASPEVDLQDVELVNYGKDSFQLKGTAKPTNKLNEGDEIPFKIPSHDEDKAELKDVICKVISTDKSSGATTLECRGEDLNTTTADLHLLSASNNTYDLNLNVKNWTNPREIQTGKYYKETPTNNMFYRKSSSGLSGGAIAGIVIACVVVLAAASIAAIMLRKPAPPIDNTTVVGLKTVDNI